MKHIRPVGIIAAFSVMFAVSPVAYARSAPEDDLDWWDENGGWTDEEYDPEDVYDSALDLVLSRLYWNMEDDIVSAETSDDTSAVKVRPA